MSDSTRRKEYDALYGSRANKNKTDAPDASANFFSSFASMFGGEKGGANSATGATAADRPDAENIFADVFEDVSFCRHACYALSSWSW